MKIVSLKKQGFTLIETELVLLITVSFLLFPTIYFDRWQSYCENELFYTQFEHSYQRAQQGAIVERRQSDIVCDVKAQEISFSYYQHGQKKVKILILPKKITLINEPKVHLMVGTGGNSGVLNSFYFRDELSNAEVTYSCQMGNAKIIKHVTSGK